VEAVEEVAVYGRFQVQIRVVAEVVVVVVVAEVMAWNHC